MEKLMAVFETDIVARLVADKAQEILPEWLDLQKNAGSLQTGRISEAELAAQCREFLGVFRDAIAKGGVDIANPAYTAVLEFLGEVSVHAPFKGFLPGRHRRSYFP
jgi:rsbT co-antagonist protein RsbR